MDPLSLRTRRWYSIISSVAFIVVLVFAVLYASGYHLKGFSVVETGAIHVSVPVPDASVLLNGKEVGKSGLLTRAFFLDNLAPGDYVLEARLTGYYPWTKDLVVAPKIVTDVPALLIPITLTFDKAPFPDLATEATTTETEGGLALSVESGTAIVRWTRSVESVPAAFCLAPGSCVLGIIVATGGVIEAHFFDGGVVYDTPQGIFIAEADVKQPRLVVPLYPHPGATFRIDHRRLYIKDGSQSYEVSGF